MSKDSIKANLIDHCKYIKSTSIRNLFKDDASRFDKLSISIDHMLLDFSKQHINAETVKKLAAYASACDLENWRDRMFNGDIINISEQRAVLHTALRTKETTPILVDGEDIIPQISETLARVKNKAETIRTEKKFSHIVNIGIGGSDLGAAMAYEALKPFTDRDITLHFVSNVDATHLAEVLRVVDPARTLFIICSKTFTTLETMTNAHSARKWLEKELGTSELSHHFLACTQNVEIATEFGITEDNIFPIWDWVGGRYSLWSAIGLPLCIALGATQFQKFLDGAYAMDKHFKDAPLEKNIPVMLAMLGVWNRNFLNYPALSVVPYDQYLWRFPAYLQQLDMESNGKSCDRDGNPVDYATGPLILGETGTNAQHAYFQLLHQGTDITPVEFIAFAKTQNPIGDHHKKLLANVIAQSKAMMEGKDSDDINTLFEGNRPSSTILLDELNPYTLGMLLSLYELKVFVQGVIWNINSFDQCGVELGKVLAKDILKFMESDLDNIDTDSSTKGLLKAITQMQKT